jgi:hypothetical protein
VFLAGLLLVMVSPLTDNKETLWIGTKGYYNSIGIQFYRKGFVLLQERKRTFITRDLIVIIPAICSRITSLLKKDVFQKNYFE